MYSGIFNNLMLKNLLNKCKQTSQNPIYHGEGNVYNHIQLCLKEYNLIKHNLNKLEQFILKRAIYYHDLGKTKCTIIEDNEITSKGHSKIGYHIALELLDKLDISFEIKKEIVMLILYHNKPFWLHEKSEHNQHYEIIKMSLDCNLKLLYYLSLCDTKGRIANDINDKVDNIEYFKLQSMKLNCLRVVQYCGVQTQIHLQLE